MSALDTKIDDLYQLPLGEFTGARNALAKTLKGDDAALVRALAKPTVVPWAANQVYWRARSTHDRLMKSGQTLRAAQIAALEGRTADVRAAGDAHRRAINDAVAEAERLAAPAGAKPNADVLARTFEALSLGTKAPEQPGRLTKELQPAGFEALAGLGNLANLELKTKNLELAPKPEKAPANDERRTPNVAREEKAARLAAEEAARVAAERKTREAAVRDAEAQVARAEMTERASRESWERAHDALLETRKALTELKSRLKSQL